jgi:hypothetical protein
MGDLLSKTVWQEMHIWVCIQQGQGIQHHSGSLIFMVRKNQDQRLSTTSMKTGIHYTQYRGERFSVTYSSSRKKYQIRLFKLILLEEFRVYQS